jgi:hypothetical protein
MTAHIDETVRQSIEKALQGKDELVYNVTPNVAKELLKETTTTKNLSRKRIAQFRQQILNGEWQDTQPLSMEDVDKLAAIIESGKTVKAYIRRGGHRGGGGRNNPRNYKREEIMESIEEMSGELSKLQAQIDKLRQRL